MERHEAHLVLARGFDEIRRGERRARVGELRWLATSFRDVLRAHSGALASCCERVGVDPDRILLLLSGSNTTALSAADREALELCRPIAAARQRFAAGGLEPLLPAPGDMRAVRWWPRVQVKGRRGALVRQLPEVRGEIFHIGWRSPLVRTEDWLEAAFELTAYAARNYRPVRDPLPERRVRREQGRLRGNPAWLADILEDLMGGSTSQSPD